MCRRLSAFLLVLSLVLSHGGGAFAEDPAPSPPAAKPDPSGENTGDVSTLGLEKPKYELSEPKKDDSPVALNQSNFNSMATFMNSVSDNVGKNRLAINMMWTLITGFLVMFMQAGFAMVETGLTRAKNVAHTMAMNFMVYAIGMLGFYLVGFAIMYGGIGKLATLNNAELLNSEFTIKIAGKEMGLFGFDGFLLTGKAFDVSILTMFLFQMVFMDTTATIPTGTMAERWKFLPFVIYGFFVSMIIYPVYGNWVWGGGWLAKLGANFGLGHGHVDFAGSSVVHMVGGVTALAGGLIIGPRIGKYNKDGTPNALPAHNVPMYMVGTFILAFGWFGFNAGSTLAGSDLVIARAAANTMLASAAGAFASMAYMWIVYKKPDPSFMCNGMLAGLVAITAPCAFVTPGAAVIIGVISGVLVIWSCLIVEKVFKVDDPVGAVSVHGVNGLWGVLALGLFADGTYGKGWNGSYWYKIGDQLQWFEAALSDADLKAKGAEAVGVTGLLYGNPSQFFAQCLGVGANILWVFPVALGFFWVVEKLLGNRVKAEDEVQGLDIPEMGVLGYINEDPKNPETTLLHVSAEPKSADRPPNGINRFTLSVSGVDTAVLAKAWSQLCLPTEKPQEDFKAIYPYMTTVSGNRFTFRGGDRKELGTRLKRLIQEKLPGRSISVDSEN